LSTKIRKTEPVESARLVRYKQFTTLGRICGKDKSLAWNGRAKEWWIVQVVMT